MSATFFRRISTTTTPPAPRFKAAGLPALATNPALGSAQTLAGGILTLGCLGNSSTSLNALDLNDSFSDGEFSGTGVLSWKPLNNLLTYASYSKGYKAGGYNLDRFNWAPRAPISCLPCSRRDPMRT